MYSFSKKFRLRFYKKQKNEYASLYSIRSVGLLEKCFLQDDALRKSKIRNPHSEIRNFSNSSRVEEVLEILGRFAAPSERFAVPVNGKSRGVECMSRKVENFVKAGCPSGFYKIEIELFRGTGDFVSNDVVAR